MEDSSFYTLQEIEKLKQKVLAYRETLMTLKLGTSLDDYLVMKSELDVLKTQIAYIEELTRAMDEKQHTQNEVYEEQVKQFSSQISVLKQTVEEINHEILSISNKLDLNNGKKVLENTTAVQYEEPLVNNSNGIVTITTGITPINNQISTVPNQPSYMQLRNLARQVSQPQRNQENIAPVEQIQYKDNQKDPRNFNQRYFQSINTHPDQIYNGLYKNTLGKSPLRFKNTEGNQEIPSDELEQNHLSSSIEQNNKSASVSITDEKDDNNLVMEEQVQRQPVESIKKIKETESIDRESKKQKNALFFNFFRK